MARTYKRDLKGRFAAIGAKRKAKKVAKHKSRIKRDANRARSWNNTAFGQIEKTNGGPLYVTIANGGNGRGGLSRKKRKANRKARRAKKRSK